MTLEDIILNEISNRNAKIMSGINHTHKNIKLIEVWLVDFEDKRQ